MGEGTRLNKSLKNIFLISFSVFSFFTYANTYYIATNGNDTWPGTKEKPWATWHKAFITANNPGDTTYFRGGIYYTTKVSRANYISGTASKPICFFAYPGERPILDGRHCTSTTEGVVFHYANYLKLKGLTVRNFHQLGYRETDCAGFYLYKCGHVTLDQCTAHDIGYRGFYFYEPDSLFVYNCDSYNIVDSLSVTPGNAGDGYIMTHFGDTTDYALFRGCRAWQVSDDGWDIHTNGYIELDSCWAFKCGGYEAFGYGNGLKLNLSIKLDRNMISRRVTNCLIVYNRNHGVKTNDNDGVAIPMQIYNNTSAFNGTYGHKGYGYAIYNTGQINSKEIRREFINNVSFANTASPAFIAGSAVYTHSNNTWDSDVTVEQDDFVHLDSTGIQGVRKADGSLPDLNGFLKLKETSDLIDAGIDVGLSFSGVAPDIGAYEYDAGPDANKSPKITMVSPSNGQRFAINEDIVIKTLVSDPDGSVTKVEFYNETTKLGERTSAPWTYTWSASQEGTYYLRAVAYDNSNASTTSPAIPVTVKNHLPVVSITSPTSGQVFAPNETITIKASASDPDGSVTKVEFFNGASKLGEKTSGPWSFIWNNVPEGDYSLTAVATDNANAEARSSAILIAVKNQTPEVSIESPSEGQIFTSNEDIVFDVNASDPDGSISKVEYYYGSIKLGERKSSPWSVTWQNVPAGNYSLSAVAFDNFDAKSTSAVVSIAVTNRAPEITIVAPVNGQVFESDETFIIATNASDPDGSITKVEFYTGSKKVGERTSSPWSYELKNIPEGNYTLTAVATDNLEAKTASAEVFITVKDPPKENILPAISIEKPISGQLYEEYANIIIDVSAFDPDGSVVKVEYYNGSDLLGEQTSSPWTYTWRNVAEGNYSLTAVATDNSNARATSSVISITVHRPTVSYINQAPVVSIANPTMNQIYETNQNASIDIDAFDPDGFITKMELFNGSTRLGIRTTYPWNFNWRSLPEGTHTLVAIATDNSEAQSSSSEVIIHVENPSFIFNEPPWVSITNPTSNQLFNTADDILISASAMDLDGMIEKVEFFNGTEKLGERTSSPWTMLWEDVDQGVYPVTAVATDNLNALTTSSPVWVYVDEHSFFDVNFEMLNLFPNPNNGHFSISLSEHLQAENHMIVIISSDGKIVSEEMVFQEETTKEFNLTHLQPGIYTLKLFNTNRTIVAKFVKH